MGQSFYPTNTVDFIAWLDNFIVVAGANLASLNLTAEDITALRNLRNSLQAKLNEKSGNREAAFTSTRALKGARRATSETGGLSNRIFKAGKETGENLLQLLGLNATDDHLSAVKPVATSSRFSQTISLA